MTARGAASGWVEVSRRTWSRSVPPAPNGSNPRAGQMEYVTEVTTRRVWPADGSLYAGRSYDTVTRYLASAPDAPMVCIGMSQFPTPADDFPCCADPSAGWLHHGRPAPAGGTVDQVVTDDV